MNIVNLVKCLGEQAINYQWLNTPDGCLQAIRTDEATGVSTVQLQTKAITINSVAENRGPVGLILWCDRQTLDIVMKAMKNGTP